MAQRVGTDIALLFHDRSTRRGEWSAARPSHTLPPGKTRYPLYRRLGGQYNKLYKGNGNAVPLQAWSGPEGSRKLRFPYFMTTAHGGGKVVSLRHRPHLPPGNSTCTHFC